MIFKALTETAQYVPTSIINTTKSNSVTVKNVVLWVDLLTDDEGDDGVLREVVKKFNEF